MKYCSHCSHPVEHIIPPGEDRPRFVCPSCGAIHYQNPHLIVGVLPVYGEKILLCKRAIEPRKGLWTLPAGFMENNESSQQGALRETWEEARAKIDSPQLYRFFDLPYISQVYLFYRGDVIDGAFEAGPESLEVSLFAESQIPWQELAFPVVKQMLEEYFEDRKIQKYPIRSSTIERLIS